MLLTINLFADKNARKLFTVEHPNPHPDNLKPLIISFSDEDSYVIWPATYYLESAKLYWHSEYKDAVTNPDSTGVIIVDIMYGVEGEFTITKLSYSDSPYLKIKYAIDNPGGNNVFWINNDQFMVKYAFTYYDDSKYRKAYFYNLKNGEIDSIIDIDRNEAYKISTEYHSLNKESWIGGY